MSAPNVLTIRMRERLGIGYFASLYNLKASSTMSAEAAATRVAMKWCEAALQNGVLVREVREDEISVARSVGPYWSLTIPVDALAADMEETL